MIPTLTKLSVSTVGVILFVNCCWCNPIPGIDELVAVSPPLVREIETTEDLEQLIHNGTSLDSTVIPECSTDGIDPSLQPFNGIRDPRRRWKNFYVFMDNSFNNNERTLINNAMYRLSRVIPCVRFGIWPRGSKPSGDYVNVKKANGCWSYVGKLGGSQDMSLAQGCLHMGTIMHEMIHALGFWHEQSRPDRDDFVRIHWENIGPGHEHNFRKFGSNEVDTFGVRYNQRSIMHYGGRDFSRNGRPTITAKNGGAVGSTGDLQQTDIDKLKRMYRC